MLVVHLCSDMVGDIGFGVVGLSTFQHRDWFANPGLAAASGFRVSQEYVPVRTNEISLLLFSYFVIRSHLKHGPSWLHSRLLGPRIQNTLCYGGGLPRLQTYRWAPRPPRRWERATSDLCWRHESEALELEHRTVDPRSICLCIVCGCWGYLLATERWGCIVDIF